MRSIMMINLWKREDKEVYKKKIIIIIWIKYNDAMHWKIFFSHVAFPNDVYSLHSTSYLKLSRFFDNLFGHGNLILQYHAYFLQLESCNLYVIINGKTYLKVKLKELGFFGVQGFDILWETQSQMETFYNKLGNAISILMYFLFYKFKWIGRSCRNIHAIINHNHGELELQYDIPLQSYLFSRHLPSPVPGC